MFSTTAQATIQHQPTDLSTLAMNLPETAASHSAPDTPSRVCFESKTHWDDLPTHSHRFMAGVAEVVPVDGNGFPVVLVSPASIVTLKKKNNNSISDCWGPCKPWQKAKAQTGPAGSF